MFVFMQLMGLSEVVVFLHDASISGMQLWRIIMQTMLFPKKIEHFVLRTISVTQFLVVTFACSEKFLVKFSALAMLAFAKCDAYLMCSFVRSVSSSILLAGAGATVSSMVAGGVTASTMGAGETTTIKNINSIWTGPFSSREWTLAFVIFGTISFVRNAIIIGFSSTWIYKSKFVCNCQITQNKCSCLQK